MERCSKYSCSRCWKPNTKIHPLLAGTYLIKFEDDGGRESAAPVQDLIGTIQELRQIPAPSQRLAVGSH